MTDMIPVASSNISGYSFDSNTGALIVAFISGAEYQYLNVPQNIVDEVFKSSGSIGSAFHHQIKNNFQYQKVN